MTMTTIRVKKDERYFSASNEPFNDKRLSWEARGLMGYLLSKPNDWEVRMTDLEKQGPAGNFKLRRMLAELRKSGYMNRIRITKAGGKFDWITEVYESPSQNPKPQKGIVKLSSGGKTTSGSSTSGKPTDILSTEELSTELNGADAPSMENMPLDWQIGTGQKTIVIPDEKETRMKDTANLIAMGTGVMSSAYYSIAMAFMKARQIVIAESKVKGQRKAIKEMVESKVYPEHVAEAVKKLTGDGLTVTDLFSVSKTAISLANPSPTDQANRREYKPFTPKDDSHAIPNPYRKPRIATN